MALFFGGNILNEMAYPVAFNMEEFKSLTSFKSRIRYCLDKLGNPLGTGSARKVFPIDNEKVLKLAINQKGLAQNEAEDDWFLQNIGIAAKVYDVDENYRWIEMQRARKAKLNDFKRFSGGYDFDFIRAYIEYVYSLYGRQGRWGWGFSYLDDDKKRTIEEIMDSDFYSDSLFYRIYEYMANYTLQNYGDLMRLSSWGVVSEDGQEDLVLVDFGLNDDVAEKYYNRRRLFEENIKEAVKRALRRLLNEEEEWYGPFEEAYENISPYSVLCEFLSDKKDGIECKQWNLIPAEQYKNLLSRYIQSPEMARIPYNVVNGWINLICENLVTLEAMTALAGHSSYFPEDDFKEVFGDAVENLNDHSDYYEFLYKIGFYEWCKLPDGSDAISDYGIEPIGRILQEVNPNSTAEDLLVIVNRCLDVFHCRGDLASTFIEGGSRTCSSISGIER